MILGAIYELSFEIAGFVFGVPLGFVAVAVEKFRAARLAATWSRKMTNWKTFVPGVLAVLPIAWTCYVEKRWPTHDEISIIVAALGIGTMAKDFDVTGGKRAS